MPKPDRKERFVVVGFRIHGERHSPQVPRGGLLLKALLGLETSEEFDGILQVEQRLDVSMPIVIGGDALKNHLVDPESGIRDFGQGCEQEIERGNAEFVDACEQIGVGGWRDVIANRPFPPVCRVLGVGFGFRQK
jgi:hypothetical protein